MKTKPDRIALEHLALSRNGRRVNLFGATVEAVRQDAFTLFLPGESITRRGLYSLKIGGTRTPLLAGTIPIREVVTFTWRSPPPVLD